MRIAAFNRLTRTRLVSTGCAAAIGAFALSGLVATGTAEAATPTPIPTPIPAPITASIPAAAPAVTPAPTTYTVQSGDSLIMIANAQHLTGGWQTLASTNNLVSPYIIQPGDVLNLPSLSSAGSTTTTTTPAVVKKTSSTATAHTASATTYPNNLDGWIRHSLAIMKQQGIPGSYYGIHRNIMRESSGNPNAVNNWDSNAAAGIPSKGLLQVIQPTFNTYHVPGTSWNLFDPVANITAACNYAYHRYGSMDNVNSAY
jgi:hypothetical protein